MKRNFFIALVALMAISQSADAQILDFLNQIKDKVDSTAINLGIKNASIEGTWPYSGPAVEIKSSNLLNNIAGSAATSALEKKLDEPLQKIGIKPGSLSFEFKSDKSFIIYLKSKQVATGTYTQDGSNLEMSFSSGLTNTIAEKIKSEVSLSGNDLQILFNADKLVTVIEKISSVVNSQSLSLITSALKEYDDVKVGFKFTKSK